jgi:hypothetical protein
MMNDEFWQMPILWENGLGGLGGFARIFLISIDTILKQKIKKNPYKSAQSA